MPPHYQKGIPGVTDNKSLIIIIIIIIIIKTINPLVVGVLGCVSKGLSRWMDIIGITVSVGMAKKQELERPGKADKDLRVSLNRL